MNESRKQYLDYLRVFSALAVVFIHVVGAYIDTYSIGTAECHVLTAFDSIIRWSVPVFVMISGAVMLRKDYSYKAIVAKTLRIILIYILWSFLYAGYAFLDGERLKNVFSVAVTGATHLWYLPLTAGLYFMIPIFYRIVSNKKLTEYILIIGFIINFFLPTIAGIIKMINPFIGQTFQDLIKMYNLPVFTAYPIYFLLGKYIDVYIIPKKKTIFIKTIAGFCFIGSVAGNLLTFGHKNPDLWFSSTSTIFVFFQSLAIFLILKEKTNSDNNHNLLRFISKNTFGIYLIHYVFTKILSKYVIHTNILLFILFIIASVIAIYTISLIISAILKKIPILNRIV